MTAIYELDIVEQPMIIDDPVSGPVTYTVRQPDFNGAQLVSWGQIDDRGQTMIVSVTGEPDQIALLPAGRQR